MYIVDCKPLVFSQKGYIRAQKWKFKFNDSLSGPSINDGTHVTRVPLVFVEGFLWFEISNQ